MPARALAAASLFEIGAREYEHIAFDASARATARTVILALAVGIVLAALYNFYLKTVPGGIVRALLAANAHEESSAQTLANLGLAKNPLYRFAAAHDLTLRRLLCKVQQEDEDTPRYYIPKELKYRADVRFEQKGNGVMTLILTAVIAPVLAIVLMRVLPAALTLFDKLL